MGWQAFVLLFPLLFPSYGARQEALERAWGQDYGEYAASAVQGEEVQRAIEDEWRGLLARGQQDDGFGIELPDELLNPRYGPQSEASALASGNGEGAAEAQYLNSMRRLSFFEYGEELFARQALPEGRRGLVNVNGSTVVRATYDGQYRLRDRTYWNNAPTSDAIKVERYVSFAYGEGAAPVSRVDEDYKAGRVVDTRFVARGAARGRPSSVATYALVPDPASTDDAPLPALRELVKTASYTYDGRGRVLTETEELAVQVPDARRRGRTKASTVSRRNVYTYTGRADTPDLKFYENGRLRMLVTYLSPDSYEETMYFENGIGLRVRYDHGRKVEEAYYSGDMELSRRALE